MLRRAWDPVALVRNQWGFWTWRSQLCRTAREPQRPEERQTFQSLCPAAGTRKDPIWCEMWVVALGTRKPLGADFWTKCFHVCPGLWGNAGIVLTSSLSAVIPLATAILFRPHLPPPFPCDQPDRRSVSGVPSASVSQDRRCPFISGI